MGHACLPAGVRVLRDMCGVQALGFGAPEVGGLASYPKLVQPQTSKSSATKVGTELVEAPQPR